MPSPSRHLAVHVARPVAEVYAYAADPRHLPEWAPGLCTAIEESDDGRWVARSGDASVVLEFAPLNPFGVLDHVVTLPGGRAVLNPLRVVPHDDGAEVVFALRRQPGMSDEEFERDAAAVLADLERLREVVERLPG